MFDLNEFGLSAAHSLFGGQLAIGLSASWETPSMTITAQKDRTPQPGNFDGVEFTSYGRKTEQEPLWRLGLLYHQPLALRAGYYFDPAHDIEYRGADSTSQVIYTGGEDVQHLSAGAGMLFRESLQVDMAFDAADDTSYRSAISFAYRY